MAAEALGAIERFRRHVEHHGVALARSGERAQCIGKTLGAKTEEAAALQHREAHPRVLEIDDEAACAAPASRASHDKPISRHTLRSAMFFPDDDDGAERRKTVYFLAAMAVAVLAWIGWMLFS